MKRNRMDADALVSFLIRNGREWIVSQRDAHHPHAIPVSASDRAILQGYFRRTTLERARIRRVAQLENPPFYTDLARAGAPMPLDFRTMAGVTFGDTILIGDSQSQGQPWIALLFHEMVHVAQYAHLGVDEFANQYVLGWAQNGYDYVAIPLEREAYDLTRRFSGAPSDPFFVEGIVEAGRHVIPGCG